MRLPFWVCRLDKLEKVDKLAVLRDAVMTHSPALMAIEVGPPARETNYPEPFMARVAGRERRPLGEAFGLVNFGVNLTRLAPGAASALRHWHTKQDEFVYILEGRPTLVTNAGRTSMRPGMCAGFKSGTGDAHHLLNETDADVLYLEIGDRRPDDEARYPDDDLNVTWVDGNWGRAMHKDGTPY